jgi:hypothetical protein
LWVKLETTKGWKEMAFDFDDDEYVTSLVLSSVHGPLMILPFTLNGNMYVKSLPPGLSWDEMPQQ